MIHFLKRLDWVLVGSLVPLFTWSLFTLKAVGSGDDYFFIRQAVWICISIVTMLVLSYIDWRIFANSGVLMILYAAVLLLLLILFLSGIRVKGAVSWFDFYAASFQPAEAAKLVLILILAKYFSRRHIDIARFRHILISGLYALLPVGLILLQPDLGSAIILVAIWFCITATAGIRLRHFVALVGAGIVVVILGWSFLLASYQKDRITSFINPTLDPQGTGYNALQSMIAVGSGQLLGKGVGYGSQSRLKFLPESHTDFIFAAFAEEWGFIGAALLFVFLSIVIWRILKIGRTSPYNFIKLLSVGLSVMIVVQITIHAGMNMGLLPVTGITFPFLSYGGSSLLILMVGIGILQNVYSKRYVQDKALSSDFGFPVNIF